MARIPREDIGGVGPANASKLEALGCESVADVRDFDTRAVRKVVTVFDERLVQESLGTACLDLKEVAPTRRSCAASRSFSDRVEDLATMEQAVATHAARLSEKLRAGGLATDHVTVFFHTSEHDRDRPVCFGVQFWLFRRFGADGGRRSVWFVGRFLVRLTRRKGRAAGAGRVRRGRAWSA